MDKAAFLGPKAENADELERLLLEVLHDHVFWRRNFHPEDPRLIAEYDKRGEAFGVTTARLRDELFQILAELKRGAPLFSPRQIGHMVTDPSLPALVGYFAGLLYNQNNVVAEAAPETVRKEHAFIAALARMVGYPELLPEQIGPENESGAYSWGHLASGGTSANLEALWVARNVRLYPLAIRALAARERDFGGLGEMEVRTADGRSPIVRELGTMELFNLPLAEVTRLHRRVREWLGRADGETREAFDRHLPTVRRIGLAGLMDRYNRHFPSDPMRPPVVLISRAAHYGWQKAMDVGGLGASALRMVDVDRHLRLSVDALSEALRQASAAEHPVLMVVSIPGTTEEGSVDPLHRVSSLRADLAGTGVTFWHHADAAFGGYLAAAIPRDDAGKALPYDPAREDLLDPDVYAAVAAMAETDSLTIDPHKWGYVPYPAGAILFRDYRVRDAVAYAAPYLPSSKMEGFGGFLGRWTLEGSRPGAPAVAAFLSQAVLPLDESGHGQLVRKCIRATREIVSALEEEFASGSVRFSLLAPPDSVGFCFALVPSGGVSSVEELNAFNRAVWRHVNVDGREDIGGYKYILSKTELSTDLYAEVLSAIIPDEVIATSPGESVMLLRAFVVNPFITDWNEGERQFATAFAEFIGKVARTLRDQGEWRTRGQRLESSDGGESKYVVIGQPANRHRPGP